MKSPAQWLRVARDGVREPGTGGSQAGQALVARSLLRTKRMSLQGLSGSERQQVLRNQLVAWQPFPNPHILIQDQGPEVLALAWDADAVRSMLAASGRDPDRIVCWPEIAWRAPLAQGVRLVGGIDGVDAEVWREGMLISSRWWPQVPDDVQWSRFLSSVKVPSTPLPRLVDGTSLSQRRPGLRLTAPDAQGQTARSLEARVAPIMAVLVVAGTAAMTHRLWQAHAARDVAVQAYAAAGRDAAPVMRARDEALREQATLESLSAYLKAPLPVEVIHHLGSVMPKGTSLKEFELQDLDLRMSLAMPGNASRSGLIKQAQDAGWITDLREGVKPPGAEVISLTGRLKGPLASLSALASGSVTQGETSPARAVGTASGGPAAPGPAGPSPASPARPGPADALPPGFLPVKPG